MKLADYLHLWRAARRRARSEQDYFEFQAFQARRLLDYLASKGVVLSGRRVLDLGSGIGGYSQEFARLGADVISVDLVQPRRPPLQQMVRLQANALRVPLRAASVDIVFCASLIEHVARPEAVLSEIQRVLKAGGISYVSFPPYYSPVGGHEFAPFHYLGERLAMRLVRRKHVVPDWVSQLYASTEDPKDFSDLYRGWGLYKMTIRKFRGLVAGSGLTCLDVSTRYLPVSFVRWPILGEFLTWHAQFLLAKPSQSRERSKR